MIYEGLRHYFTSEGQKSPGSIAKLVSGALSGALAQTCTYPLYVACSLVVLFSMELKSDSLPGMYYGEDFR
jgi:hypothetical protein